MDGYRYTQLLRTSTHIYIYLPSSSRARTRASLSVVKPNKRNLYFLGYLELQAGRTKKRVMIGFIKRMYYRYTLCTGVTMLMNTESFILHSSILLGMVLFFRYFVMFFSQIVNALFITKAEVAAQ